MNKKIFIRIMAVLVCVALVSGVALAAMCISAAKKDRITITKEIVNCENGKGHFGLVTDGRFFYVHSGQKNLKLPVAKTAIIENENTTHYHGSCSVTKDGLGRALKITLIIPDGYTIEPLEK